MKLEITSYVAIFKLGKSSKSTQPMYFSLVIYASMTSGIFKITFDLAAHYLQLLWTG